MKSLLTTVLIAGVSMMTPTADSFAGANANARILLHLLAPTTKAPCSRIAAKPACRDIVVQGNLHPQVYFAYVLVTDGNHAAGIAGVQFGIQYTGPGSTDGVGVDIFSWSLCATLEFQMPSPQWPNSGGGNLITWDSGIQCQRTEPDGAGTGVVATAGYFYCAAYTPATFSVIPRPVDGLAKVADCQANEDIVAAVGIPHIPPSLGFAGFGGQQGYNPCGIIIDPIENTTWSAIKSTYAR